MKQAELHAKIYPTAKLALDAYLDYANNYLTVTVFAEHRGISEELAEMLINEGRTLLQMND